MKFYYSSIKPYVDSTIDSSSGEVPELRIEKASQFWAGNPHPGRTCCWSLRRWLGGLVKAWWVPDVQPCAVIDESSTDPDYSESTSWGCRPVLLEIQLRTRATCSVSPNPEELTSLATWQIHSVIQSDRGQTEGAIWQMWRRCPDLFLRLLEIIDKFNCGRSLPTPVSVPLHLCREMNLGFVVVFIRW